MGIELGHHINQLLEAKAEDLSIVSDNHSSHHRRQRRLQQGQQEQDGGEDMISSSRSRSDSSSSSSSSSCPPHHNQAAESSEKETEEDDDVLTELFSIGTVGMSFSIVADNPRSHVKPKKKKKKKGGKSLPFKSRLVHSSSAPVIPSCGRWEVGTAVSISAKKRPSSSSSSSSRGGSLNMKIPTRHRSSSKSGGSSSGENCNPKSQKNASWGTPGNHKPQSSMMIGASSMDKTRLKSLGLDSFSSVSSSSAAAKKQLGAARWSIPKRGSDSALIYPRRSNGSTS